MGAGELDFVDGDGEEEVGEGARERKEEGEEDAGGMEWGIGEFGVGERERVGQDTGVDEEKEVGEDNNFTKGEEEEGEGEEAEAEEEEKEEEECAISAGGINVEEGEEKGFSFLFL